MNRTSSAVIVLFLTLILAACQAAPQASAPVVTAVPAGEATATAEPVPTVDVAAVRQAALDEATASMTQQEAANMAVVQRFYDDFSAGKPEVILDVHPETLTMHYAGSVEDVPTQALYEDLAAIKASIPDLHAEIHSMIAAGDYVFTELTWAGTHTGDLFGIPATGNPIMHNGILVRRLADGKIVESWEIWDDLTLLNGLGLVPSWDEIVAGETVGEEPTEAAMAAPTIPPGMYYARLRPNNALGVDSGYYAVRLGDDGSYSIVWFGTNRDNMDAGESGMEGVSGTYTIDGSKITFIDEEGFAGCTEEEGLTGVYRFTVTGNQLRFTKVSDTCGARAHIVSSAPLTRLNR